MVARRFREELGIELKATHGNLWHEIKQPWITCCGDNKLAEITKNKQGKLEK